ncbi:MAG TPA: response regulator transcription factor [Thermoanaerobaculia bacterium]|nr:response regulator transcription factor [Thermoanaerobaculia bacterium]
MKPRILIVEDDPKTAESLELYLRAAGYDTRAVHDGARGLSEAESGAYDLVLLDLMLPDMYGMDVCKRLRTTSNVPVVMLTARALEDDQVRGLELGADDYITKPFSPRQVVARVAAILRRQQHPDDDRVRIGDLELDARSLRVTNGARTANVTRTQARILRALIEARGRALSREQILERAFDGDASATERTVDAHVKNLRRKLGDAPVSIATTFGVGYRIAVGESE